MHKTRRQLDLAATYPFPGMTQRRIADRRDQCLR